MLTIETSFPSGKEVLCTLCVCKNATHFGRVNMRQPSCGLEVDIGF